MKVHGLVCVGGARSREMITFQEQMVGPESEGVNYYTLPEPTEVL